MSTYALATDRWTKILSQKRYIFNSIGFNDAILLVNSRATFRVFFEAECDRTNYQWTQRALGKLWISFDHIDAFIRILEGATLDQGDKGYTSLIWGACFAVLQCVQINPEAGLDGLDGLVQLVVDLNHSLPYFEEDSQRGYELSVQEALQDIYVSYINCCLSIICLLTGRVLPSTLTRDSYPTSARACVENAARELATTKALFDRAIGSLSVSGGRPRVQSSNDSSRRSLQSNSFMPGSWPHSTQYPVFEAYHIDKHLGSGAFGYVEKVTDTCTHKVYARKHMALPKGQDWVKFRESVWYEVNNMRSVACAHVVEVLDYQEDGEDAMEIYMNPVADNNLTQILEGWPKGKFPRLSARTVYSWFGCLLKALEFVHSKNVVHKDIKPPNILIKDQMIFLADFGLSRSFEGGASQTLGSFAGTLEYQAPEYVTGEKHGRPVDIFALGCVFSEILTALHGKDLDVFKDIRLVSVPTGLDVKIHSFHKTLRLVRGWVEGLRGNEKDDVLVETILGMLEIDSRVRKDSAEALKSVESVRDLRCIHAL